MPRRKEKRVAPFSGATAFLADRLCSHPHCAVIIYPSIWEGAAIKRLHWCLVTVITGLCYKGYIIMGIWISELRRGKNIAVTGH